MEFSYHSLLAAFALLVFGIAEYAVLQRVLYIPLRNRFERAKTTGRRVADPALFWTVMKFVNFIVLPVLGLLFGGPVLRPFLG